MMQRFYNTQDGGDSWKVQMYAPELERPLFDVVFHSEKEGIAVGSYGYFYRTKDGGNTWHREFKESLLHPDDADYLNELKDEDIDAYKEEQDSILPHFNRLLMHNSTLVLVGEIGLIASSSDFGKTFVKQDEIYQGSFFDVAAVSEEQLIIVGLRGHVFAGNIQQNQWREIETGTTSLLNDVITKQGKIVIIGNAGTVLESPNINNQFSLTNQEDGKALISGVLFNGKLVVTSEVGIKSITLK